MTPEKVRALLWLPGDGSWSDTIPTDLVLPVLALNSAEPSLVDFDGLDWTLPCQPIASLTLTAALTPAGQVERARVAAEGHS